MSKFDMLIEGIPMSIGRAGILSLEVIRAEGKPSIMLAHLNLDGKEYAMSLFPLDMQPPEEADETDESQLERLPARRSKKDNRSLGGAKTK